MEDVRKVIMKSPKKRPLDFSDILFPEQQLFERSAHRAQFTSLDLMTIRQGPIHCNLINKFQIRSNRHPHCNAGNFYTERL